MSKKYVLLDLMETGGEYVYGFINDKSLINIIKDKIENEEDLELEFNFIDKNGDEQYFPWFEYDQVLHCYGPNVSYDTSCSIEILNDEENFDYSPNFDKNEETIYSSISELGINLFSHSNPDTYNDKKYKNLYKKNSIEFGGYRIEKRIHFPILIPINKDEVDYSNVFISSINLDETLCGDEIAYKAYYIPKDIQLEILKEYNNDYDENDCLNDYIGEIFYDEDINKDLINKIEQYSLVIGEISGKGDSENQYIVFKDIKSKEILYENEYY